MSITDPHDRRIFRQFVKLAADGSVLATTLVAEGAPDPEDGPTHTYLDLTHAYPSALDAGTVRPKLLDNVRAARAAIREGHLTIAVATDRGQSEDRAAVVTAERDLRAAHAVAAGALRSDAVTKRG